MRFGSSAAGTIAKSPSQTATPEAARTLSQKRSRARKSGAAKKWRSMVGHRNTKASLTQNAPAAAVDVVFVSTGGDRGGDGGGAPPTGETRPPPQGKDAPARPPQPRR